VTLDVGDEFSYRHRRVISQCCCLCAVLLRLLQEPTHFRTAAAERESLYSMYLYIILKPCAVEIIKNAVKRVLSSVERPRVYILMWGMSKTRTIEIDWAICYVYQWYNYNGDYSQNKQFFIHYVSH